MPPRKSKAKPSEGGDTADPTPAVRRSARTRRSVVQDEYDGIEAEPPKKRARSARSGASAAINYEEENSSEPLKNANSEDVEPKIEEHSLKTPVKLARGKGRKVSEHKDTPYPKNITNERTASRGRKRREAATELPDSPDDEGVENESGSAIKKSKLDISPPNRTAASAIALDVIEDDETSPADLEDAANSRTLAPVVHETKAKLLNDGASEAAIKSADAIASRGEGDEVAAVNAKQEIRAKDPSTALEEDGDNARSPRFNKTTNGDSLAGKVKPPTGAYEDNSKIGDLEKDLTVASLVAAANTGAMRAALEELDTPDIVAMQRSTPSAAKDAESCGFRIFGDGATRLLVRKRQSSSLAIGVKEPNETSPLILLALDELDQSTSNSQHKKCVKDYLTAQCTPTDEFTVFTLTVDGKVVTLVNIQLESKNLAVSSLLIGCLMRKLDSRPHAFILTGYMPHVRPGTPAYELLRDGYFSNHSIETLQSMRDIKLDDEEDGEDHPQQHHHRGLVDFFWKAYQHSRPWMRSVYETVLGGESAVSCTGRAVIWHSTEGVEAIRVFNHASIVKADLAVKSES